MRIGGPRDSERVILQRVHSASLPGPVVAGSHGAGLRSSRYCAHPCRPALGYNAQLLPLSPDLPAEAAAYVCFPFSYRGHAGLALPAAVLCLLAAAGCTARQRPAPTPLPTATVRFLAVPTFTPTPTPIVARMTPVFPTATPTTISVQAEGVYADRAAHHDGSYRLQRHADRVEATFMTTRSPVQAGSTTAAAGAVHAAPGLPPARPRAAPRDGSSGAGGRQPGSRPSPDPRPFRLQLEPDGRVRYLDPPAGADLAYLAYTLHLAWGTTRGANDQAVLAVVATGGGLGSGQPAQRHG